MATTLGQWLHLQEILQPYLQQHPDTTKQIWKSQCTARVKFFTWLVLIDRLNTKTMLSKRHIEVHGDDLCVMCTTGADETIDHCSLLVPLQICAGTKSTSIGISHLAWKTDSSKEHKTMEWTSIAAWEIWKIQNDKKFNRGNPSVDKWFCNFKSQSLLQSIRFNTDLRSAFCFWLDAFS